MQQREEPIRFADREKKGTLDVSYAANIALERIYVCTQVAKYENNKKLYYWYIATTAKRLAELKLCISQDEYDPAQVPLYGHIIAEGEGEPHDELREYMATYYGYDDRRPLPKAAQHDRLPERDTHLNLPEDKAPGIFSKLWRYLYMAVNGAWVKKLYGWFGKR